MIASWYSVTGQVVLQAPKVVFDDSLSLDECVEQVASEYQLEVLIKKDRAQWAYLGNKKQRMVISLK